MIKRKKKCFSVHSNIVWTRYWNFSQRKGTKQKKSNRPYFNFSFEVDMYLNKFRDGNFFPLTTLNLLKTTVKTAVETFTSVWINSLLLMRINAIKFLQSKGTQQFRFLLLLSHNSLIHLYNSLHSTKVRFESCDHCFCR